MGKLHKIWGVQLIPTEKRIQLICRNSFIKYSKENFSTQFSSPEIFDKKAHRAHRDFSCKDAENSRKSDYLRVEVARRLVDRLEDIRREFPYALDLGSHSGQIYQELVKQKGLGGMGGIGGVQTLIMGDISETALLRDSELNKIPQKAFINTHRVLVDSDFLPFKKHSFDLVISNLHLHWINDLPSCFTQINTILKPDGVFLGSMMGGDTLTELRTCLLMAEQEREGGMSPHISPAAHLADCGSLLQEAGFSIPTIDTDKIIVHYDDAFELMEDIQQMGESNTVMNRRHYVGKETFLAAATIYQQLYSNTDGKIPATFQIIYMIGWAPHESQPKALRRGSAKKSMKETLEIKIQ